MPFCIPPHCPRFASRHFLVGSSFWSVIVPRCQTWGPLDNQVIIGVSVLNNAHTTCTLYICVYPLCPWDSFPFGILKDNDTTLADTNTILPTKDSHVSTAAFRKNDLANMNIYQAIIARRSCLFVRFLARPPRLLCDTLHLSFDQKQYYYLLADKKIMHNVFRCGTSNSTVDSLYKLQTISYGYTLILSCKMCSLVDTTGSPRRPGGPGNLSIPIRFYYRIRELNF
jgi:hypothetical protein